MHRAWLTAILVLGCSGDPSEPAGGSGGNAGASSGGSAGSSSGGGAGSSSGGGAGAFGGASGDGGSAGGGGVTSGACTVSDTSGCVPGTTLDFLDEQFLCNQPLSSYGTLPLRVVLDFTPGKPFGENGAVDLTTGCSGDSDPESIDLIVDVRGDGATYGPGVDAFKVRLEAGYDASIQITGHADCGPRLSADQHQDGIQLQGGRDITFVDFSIGNYAAGLSTCQGAGGAFFYSGAGGYSPEAIDIVRGKYIACNHSLLAGNAQATGSVSDASFRSGRTDGSDPVCVGYAASNPCIDQADGVTFSGLTCESWENGQWQ